MRCHEIMFPALQKYYSALKSLDEFDRVGNFFDDVSNLDKFFSEFRNITFVIQKAVKKDENKKIYTELREKYLSGDTAKWFVTERNKITKEKPFDLTKELIIDMYLPFGIFSLKDENLKIDFNESFEKNIDYIRSFWIEELGLTEVYFTSKIIFREANESIDFYPKIKLGIVRMHSFMKELENNFSCDCEMCNVLKSKIENLYKNVQFKEISFSKDYAMELGKDVVEGDKAEIYVETDTFKYAPLETLRLSLDNEFFRDVKDSIENLYLKFISMHATIFRMQQHEIMPVFMIVYKDLTYRMMPFVATAKTTYYRKLSEVINISDFNEINAVLFCGEQYIYAPEKLSEILDKPYSERIYLSEQEILTFIIIVSNGNEMVLALDKAKVDDLEYVSEQIKKLAWNNADTVHCFDWLNPLRLKFKQSSKD